MSSDVACRIDSRARGENDAMSCDSYRYTKQEIFYDKT